MLQCRVPVGTHTTDTLQTNTLVTLKTNSSLPASCCSRDVHLKVAIIFPAPDEPDGLRPAALTSIII